MTVASVKPEAYRHLHEALDATAQHVPDLQHVLADQEAAGELILCWNGMLIHTDAFADGKSQSTTTQTTATMVLRIKRLAGSPLSTGVSATNLQVLSAVSSGCGNTSLTYHCCPSLTAAPYAQPEYQTPTFYADDYLTARPQTPNPQLYTHPHQCL